MLYTTGVPVRRANEHAGRAHPMTALAAVPFGIATLADLVCFAYIAIRYFRRRHAQKHAATSTV